MLLGLKAVVAVVGCTGSVGFAASQLLSEDGYRLRLVGRSFASVEKRFPRLPKGAQIVDLETAVSQANIVVLLTNDPTSSLRPCTARAGTFFIDCAQPANLSNVVRQGLRSEGVAVVDGGLVRIPNYECTYDFNLQEAGLTFSCLAETYLFARHGLNRHSVGNPPIDLCQRLEKLAEQSQIKIRALRLVDIQTNTYSRIETVAR
jgi:predicted amino acid dehydrogenase